MDVADHDLTYQQYAIYRAVRDAANEGRVCPSNIEIAAMIDANPSHISETLRRLARKKLLMIESGTNWRVVTITENGKSTARPAYAPRIGEKRAPKRSGHDAPERVRERISKRHLIDGQELQDRIDRDQARLRERRERHLRDEQKKYGLPKMARPIDEMPA